MQRLRDVLRKAQDERVAIGHFNIADLVLLRAVFAAARDLNVPVLVGASDGEREFIGTRQLTALVQSLRDEYDFRSFLMLTTRTLWRQRWEQRTPGLTPLFLTVPLCFSNRTFVKPEPR